MKHVRTILLCALAAASSFMATASAHAVQVPYSELHIKPHYLFNTAYVVNGTPTNLFSGSAAASPTGFGDIFEFCVQYDNESDSAFNYYEVTPGLAPLPITQQAEIRALLSHELPAMTAAFNRFLAANGGSYYYSDAAAYQLADYTNIAVAIQSVIWEIEGETDTSTGVDLQAGNFQIGTNFANPYYNTAYSNAIEWAAKIKSGEWTNTGAVKYDFVNGLGSQNLIWVASVPEPTTWLMMIGGFGLVGAAIRRRRAKQVATLV